MQNHVAFRQLTAKPYVATTATEASVMKKVEPTKVIYSAHVKALFAGGLGALGLALVIAVVSFFTPSLALKQSGAVLFLFGAIAFAASLTLARAEMREQTNA